MELQSDNGIKSFSRKRAFAYFGIVFVVFVWGLYPIFTSDLLGSYSGGYAAIGLNGYRFIGRFPAMQETHLFADGDLRQENELTGKLQDEEGRSIETYLGATLDTLLKISNYTLERGL